LIKVTQLRFDLPASTGEKGEQLFPAGIVQNGDEYDKVDDSPDLILELRMQLHGVKGCKQSDRNQQERQYNRYRVISSQN
jgi:hypothetical protein